jgi:hypothetical protein
MYLSPVSIGWYRNWGDIVFACGMALSNLGTARLELQHEESPATAANALIACNDAVLMFLNVCLGGQRSQMYFEMSADNLSLVTGI